MAPKDPRQLELFPQELMQSCDERELERLQQGWSTKDFHHGWMTAAVDARTEGRP